MSPSEHFTMHQEELSAGNDGDSDLLTVQPMRVPPEGFVMHQEEMRAAPVRRPAAEAAPVCIPPDVSITVDPVSALYDLGDVIEVTAVIDAGDGPFTYEWFFASTVPAADGTTQVHNHTLVLDDVGGIDGMTGIGTCNFSLIVTGKCGQGTAFKTINVQT